MQRHLGESVSADWTHEHPFRLTQLSPHLLFVLGAGADTFSQAPFVHHHNFASATISSFPSSKLAGSSRSCTDSVMFTREGGIRDEMSPSLARRTLRTPPAFPPR
eukprot:4465902-Pyramimonas_sp.AAC.1